MKTLFLPLTLLVLVGDCEQPPVSERLSIPGVIQAEDFDRYYDTTPGNREGPNICDSLYLGDVDLKFATDIDSTCVVGLFAKDEWLEYDVTVADSTWYQMLVRYSSAVLNSGFHLEIDGTFSPNRLIELPKVGDDWNTFATAKIDSIFLPAGSHTLRIVRGQDWLDLNWIQFISQPIEEPDTTWVGSVPTLITFPNGETVGLPTSEGDPDFTLAPGQQVRFHAHKLNDSTLVIHIGPPNQRE